MYNISTHNCHTSFQNPVILQKSRDYQQKSKGLVETTLKGIKNRINNQTFLRDDPDMGELVTPCMDVYNSKIQYDGSSDKLNLRIVVRGDL